MRKRKQHGDLEHPSEAMDYNEVIVNKYGALIIINIGTKYQ